MVREREAHFKNSTWELVKLPPGRKAIGSKWIFKVKRNPHGTVEQYKARLVAKGLGQRPGVDFDKTLAPTTKWAAIRAILVLATLKDLELESIDISNAYLIGKLHDIDMYMQQPNGFAERDSTWVARLLKGLYGLKQGGHKWFRHLEGLCTRARVTCYKVRKLTNARHRRASPCRVHAATGTYTNTTYWIGLASRTAALSRASTPACYPPRYPRAL
jgi:hypothetical protein